MFLTFKTVLIIKRFKKDNTEKKMNLRVLWHQIGVIYYYINNVMSNFVFNLEN